MTTTDVSLELLLGPQLEAFVAAGYDVRGVSAPGSCTAALEARGVPHIPLAHATRSSAPVEDARALAELVRVFRGLRPTIVHTHNPKPGVYGRIAARVARVPIVVNTVHGLYALPEDPLPKRAIVYALERIAATCSHAELLQNPEDVPVLRRLRVAERKLTVLGNGIDLTRFDPASVTEREVADARAEMGATAPSDVVVGLVGRLVREKGYVEVFDVARRLRATAPSIRFAVIGPEEPAKSDGVTAAEQARAAAFGVTFLGNRTDVERLYAGMDIYVLASHREGFPRSAMEASAMALPVIATDIRGCRQVVDDGATGLLVPARDAARLGEAIVALASDAGRRARMGAAARKKAQRSFDQQRCIDVTLATYRDLLARRGLRAPEPRSEALER